MSENLHGETFMEPISQMKAFWPEWTVEHEIGRGSCGSVYKVSRTIFAKKCYSAVRVIRIPMNDSDVEAYMAKNRSYSLTRAHIRQLALSFVHEILMMIEFRGADNVVGIEDFKIIEQEEEIRWDIFIRMEYLTCLTDVITERRISEKEVAKIGIDICSALELCEEKHTVHGNIRPNNIFVSRFGTYKLGDIGIARQLFPLQALGAYSPYMAPEIYRGHRFYASADIYALGIVLYKLLNRNCMPFVNPTAKSNSYKDVNEARRRIFVGEKKPAPYDASGPMSRVILKACSAEAADRFRSAGEMKRELENCL